MSSTDQAVVHVVDDDEAVRKSLERSLGIRGYTVRTYAGAVQFLENYKDNTPGCLILDVRMPGMDGLALQQKLVELKIQLPIIFVTGHGDIPMSVRAMKEGAADFLEKPYRVEALAERINEAIAKSIADFNESQKESVIRSRFERLTPRERDVMMLLVSGAADTTSKMIARELSISHRTVDDHRASIMAKMQARSISELVSMAKTCGL